MPQKYEARMMAKMYLFLRQYMPDGLTGRWAHLRGNEVMRVLLSDREEQCVSRHKVTKKIYSSLGKLQEEWAEGLCLGTKDTDDGTVDDGAVDNVDVHVIDDTSSDPDADGEGDDQSSLGLSFPTSPTGTTIGKNTFSGYDDDDDDDDCASTAASSVELSSALEGLSKPTSTWTELGIARYLSADDKSDGALPGWVAHLLGQTHDTFTVMRTWCSFWQKWMSAAKTAEDQLLTRLLIL
ncbi:hypothetical protein NUW58_g1253 [Xylaria curta]|uniref:Uncharacterized protein n=1 Tax=Xylaria curta TaxID=42375 RepID=A0ACC1PNR3_9PEZI|nr:hypothetical protein NUW58_g1253 [Xylaria curta]